MIKKSFILLLLVLIITGCSVSYEVDFYQDGSVNENIYLIEDNSVISKYGSNIDDTVNSMLDYYFSPNSEVEPQILFSNKKNIKNVGKFQTSISLNKNYTNLNNYEKSLFGTYFFDTFSIDVNGDNVVIYANSLDYDKIIKLSSEYKYKFNFDTLNIRIKVPFVVSYSNADFMKDNVYTWIFNKSNYDRDIKIVYSNKEVVYKSDNNNVSVIDKIGETIVNTVTFGTVDGEKISNGNGGIIIFGLILVVLVIVILLFKKFISRNNDI